MALHSDGKNGKNSVSEKSNSSSVRKGKNGTSNRSRTVKKAKETGTKKTSKFNWQSVIDFVIKAFNKADVDGSARKTHSQKTLNSNESDAKETSVLNSADFENIHDDKILIGDTLDTSKMEPVISSEVTKSDGVNRRIRHRTHIKTGSDSYKVKGGKVEGKSLTFSGFVGEYLKKAWVRIMVAVFVTFLIMYVIYQLYLNYYTDVKTEIVNISTYSETIDTEGIAVRDEVIINEQAGKSAVSTVDNGEKVSKNQTIINEFKSAAAASAYKRISEINEEISELESMSIASEDSANEVGNIKMQLNGQISELAKSVDDGNLDNIAEIRGNITYLMNKRLVAMRQVEDYQSRIDSLNKEKKSLESSYSEAPSTINASDSGYYVNTLDGYENLLNTSMLSELTVSKLKSIMSQNVKTSENSVGKLIKNFSWYLACPVSAKDAEDYLKKDSVYTLILPYSETGSLQGTLVYLNEEENGQVLAVFKCYSLMSELCSVRRQPVKIQIRSYTGFNIKKSSLHIDKETVAIKDDNGKKTGEEEVSYPCVYTLVGNQVVSKRVNILYNGDKIVICSSKDTESNYLALYDKIITEGKGLYAGKIIN